MKIKMYLHGDSDNNYEQGEGLGLRDEALDTFSRALYEVICDVDVDMETGETKILGVNGKKLVEEKIMKELELFFVTANIEQSDGSISIHIVPIFAYNFSDACDVLQEKNYYDIKLSSCHKVERGIPKIVWKSE